MAFPWLAVALGASTVVTYMGSLQQAKRMKAAANWDLYNAEQKRIYEQIELNKQAAKLLSEKRARTGATGVTYEGSSLLAESEVLLDYQENLFWLNKGIDMQIQSIDTKTSLSLNKEAFERKTNLVTNALGTYAMYKSGV
jgi:hypothetical protein